MGSYINGLREVSHTCIVNDESYLLFCIYFRSQPSLAKEREEPLIDSSETVEQTLVTCTSGRGLAVTGSQIYHRDQARNICDQRQVAP